MTAPTLMPIEQALETLLSTASARISAEEITLEQADGRVLLEDIHAAIDVPPWANSAMDGYALCCADQLPGREFEVSQRIPAGVAPQALTPGTIARIFTGAPLPAGADAVVMQENCSVSDGNRVVITQPVTAGENVRRRGADVRAGSLLLSAGHRLSPAALGVLAATGITRVQVGRQPRVALITSGDELQRPGQTLAPGQIYDSNRPVLKALLSRLGLEVLDMGNMPDNREHTERLLLEASRQADCIVSSGGVSAGEEDHVRAAVQARGQLDVWKLALKPGKPFAFGQLGKALFFGLPGNPVSAYVTFLVLVRPTLLRLCGATQPELSQIMVPSGFDASASGSRQEYLRVRLNAGDGSRLPSIVPLPDQSSGILSSVMQADGLAVIPPYTSVSSGQLLRFLPFGDIV
jgi:molybdopterin molybdotransferase